MDSIRICEKFYIQNALEMAPALIGKYLCRNIDGVTQKLKITETEAYYGASDSACHAHKGFTARTSVMFERGGVAYVYLCYGIHSLLNIVSGLKDHPEAVLIRGVEGFNGPGKLTKALNIDRTLNRENLVISNNLWLEEGEQCQYTCTPRVGINYASEEYRSKLWRFIKI